MSLTKEDVKEAVHSALNERDHPCFLTQEQQHDAVDGVKVIHVFKGFITYGLAIGLGIVMLLSLLGWALWPSLMRMIS